MDDQALLFSIYEMLVLYQGVQEDQAQTAVAQLQLFLLLLVQDGPGG